MLSIAWNWRALVDFDVDRLFVVSPLFGTLHGLPLRRDGRAELPLRMRLLGCTSKTQSTSVSGFAPVMPPSTGPSGYEPDPRHQKWTQDIGQQLARLPLVLVVDAAERRSAPQGTNDVALTEPSDELITGMLQAWGYARLPECLPRALYRYEWLRSRGAKPELVIGVHLPTDLMHAWVELDRHIIGEEPDQMLCFQEAVRYFPKTGRP